MGAILSTTGGSCSGRTASPGTQVEADPGVSRLASSWETMDPYAQVRLGHGVPRSYLYCPLSVNILDAAAAANGLEVVSRCEEEGRDSEVGCASQLPGTVMQESM